MCRGSPSPERTCPDARSSTSPDALGVATRKRSPRGLPTHALSIGTRSTSMFVQSVLGPTDRPTERQEARPAEAVRASDAKIPCGIFASHGEPEGL